jgi:hypothetical protein
VYGKQTADAVLAYKKKRGIINRGYQASADNIVGKMTMASRWSPVTIGAVRCAQTGNSSLAVCTNEPDPSREPPHPVDSKIAFLWDMEGPRNIADFPKNEEGARSS